MNKHPSLIKITTIDYIACLAFLFPVIFWGLYIVLIILEKVTITDFILPIIFSVITIFAFVVLVWRIQVFNTVFDDGLESTATISSISFFRDRGRVDYVYSYQGQKYISGNAILKVKRTQALQIGEQVIVIVDRNNPKRAFIRDLYI